MTDQVVSVLGLCIAYGQGQQSSGQPNREKINHKIINEKVSKLKENDEKILVL